MKLVIDNVSKSFVNRNGQTLPVLQDINLTVNEEEFVALRSSALPAAANPPC